MAQQEKNILLYINDILPERAAAYAKLEKRLGRSLRGIVLVDAERKASGNFRASDGFPFEEIVVDFSDDAAIRKAIKPLEDNLLLVVCLSEQSQLYFKNIIPHVPYVNTPTESSLDFATDKGVMRELLRSYDPDISPKAVVVRDASVNSIEAIQATGLRYPLIVKPTNLAASMLVNKVANEDELRRVLETSFEYLEEVFSHHRGRGNKTMVVEEFVEGDLFSVDVYVDSVGKVYALPFVHFQNGAMVGMDSYQVYQSETYHTLSAEEEKEGVIVAEKAIHAIGLRSSVAHIELFHTSHGWKVIELGARAGGWRQEMYDISYGVDHALNELLVKIGLEPEISRKLKSHSTVFRVHTPYKGVLESLEGVEEARKHPSIDSIIENIKPGDIALPSTLGGEELVEGLIFNSDHDQLEKDLAAIRSTIKVTIKPLE